MKITYYPRPALLGWLVLVLALLLGGACVPENMVVSPLGMVVVGAGEDIQIRSLEALTGIGELGVPRQRAVAMALADYGPIEGHRVSMGAGLDSLCTAEGGAENRAIASKFGRHKNTLAHEGRPQGAPLPDCLLWAFCPAKGTLPIVFSGRFALGRAAHKGCPYGPEPPAF